MMLCTSILAAISIFDSPICFVERASGTTFKVNTTGSGGASTSIQVAIDLCSDGDTIYVYSGTYYENIVVDVTINLTGEDRESTIIDGGGSGHVVYVNADLVNISGFTIRNSGDADGTGIFLQSSNSNISFNSITDNERGIDLDSHFNNVFGNNIMNNSYGIYQVHANGQYISNNVISSNEQSGIYMSDTIGNVLSGNTMMQNGIYISGSDLENWNTHDIDTSNSVDGKPVYYWKDQTGGLIPPGAGQIILANCRNVNVENQELNNGSMGISLAFSSNNTITGNNASSNIYDGIYLCSSSGNDIIDNKATYNYAGIVLDENSNWNNITGNTASNNQNGIGLTSSDGNDIYNNECSSNGRTGLSIGYSTQNIVDGNKIYSNNLSGLVLSFSSGNFVTNNEVSYTTARGIYISYSSGNTVSDNTAEDNWWGIDIHHDSNLNTVSNNNLFSNFFGISVYLSTENNISNNTVTGNNLGIRLSESFKNYVVDNYLHSNSASGISLLNSTLNNITANDIYESQDGIFSFEESAQNNITENTIVSNKVGINLKDTNASNVSGNSVSYNNLGISLYNSSWNNFTYNYVLSNTYNGILLTYSSFNLIFHNRIVNNKNQAIDGRDDNYWDNGYPSGGNYWSDYIGNDSYNGPGQDILGSDCIGDTPYVIDSNSSDNYPLIEPIPDTLLPRIQLISPHKNSIIKPGVVLDFHVYDGNLDFANYSVNGGSEQPLPFPYNISTSGWADGDYVVLIKASDIAGNSNSSWFYFTIDYTPPTILFNSSLNHSTMAVRGTIQIDITDPHLDSVMYSLNGEDLEFPAPYIIDTSSWLDGTYIVNVKANDTLGNEAVFWFEVTIDAISPEVISSNAESSKDISANVETITINLTFSEPMNQTNTENHISISLPVDFECYWDETGTILSVIFDYDISPEEYNYSIIIESEITDINGISMVSNYTANWTHLSDSDNDGIPNNLDDDDDNDGYPDENDTFPLDATEWEDTDDDGIGNNADPDDDNDDVLDKDDDYPLDPTRWKKPTEDDFTLLAILVILVIVIATMIVMVLFLRNRKIKPPSTGETKGEPTPSQVPKPLPPPP